MNSRIDRIYQMTDDMHSYITQDLSSTKYFDADRISFLKITSKDLFIIHINIRSLNKNIDDLLEFLTELGTRPNIICLTETRLKQNSLVNTQIPGYKFCHVDSDTNAGGVGIYIDEEIEFVCENLYSFSKNGLENLWISINTSLTQNFVVGVVYRHPYANVKEFIDEFNNTLVKLNSKNANCIVLGDFNINILQLDIEPAASYINMLHSNAFFSLLDKSTRITESSSTLIDHVITNITKCKIVPGIIDYQLTDHLPTFVTISNIKKHSHNTTKFYRNMKQFDSNKGLYVSIRKKQKLSKSHYLRGSNNQKAYYKRYANLLTKLKTAAKKLYFENQLKSVTNNPKETWNILQELLPKKKCDTTPSSLKFDDADISDKNEIAGIFNTFFANVGHKISEDINSTKSHIDYLKNSVTSSMVLSPPTPNELATELKRLNANKSTSDNKIPTKFLIIAADVLSPYLAYLVEYMFTQGIFPDELKIAKVIPIYKTGSNQSVENYRPISLLSPFSKVIENLIKSRLISFLNKNQILYERQSGFREKHTTIFPLIDVVTQSFDNINDKLYTCAIALDIKKAFDSVNHSILLNKLSHYGIRGVCHQLFESYLINRKQYVCINDANSPMQEIKSGVPQGSVLGPILFLLYINDLSNALLCKPRLFADDTLLLYSSDNLNKLEALCNNELLLVKRWMDANKLKINTSKSQAIIINYKLRSPRCDIQLRYNSNCIQSSAKIKYLGVVIDHKLSFLPHIQNLEAKVSRNIGILFKLNKVLPISALKTLYYALVHPLLFYGIIIWGSTNNSYLTKLRSLQNKALKAIGHLGWRTSPKHLYRKFKILKLNDLYKIELSKFVYSYISKYTPQYFNDYFIEFKNANVHNTRSSSRQNLILPLYATNRVQKSIKFQGAKLWNSLPFSLKQSSRRKFLKTHKELIFQNYI